jgi:two-component sensor histidine kinase
MLWRQPNMFAESQSPELPPPGIPVLSGESDHRIANSLGMISSLVRLRAAKATASESPRTLLMEIADRIDTVGQLHRLIAQSSGGTVQLSKYLQEICDRLGALASDGVSFSVGCSPEQIVPFTIASPLGLITAELFSNSLKYAHPTGLPVKISISCNRSEEHQLTFVYEDDGVGFPEGYDIAHDGHLGMQFIRLLSKQLRGTPDWLSDPIGIRFKVLIPMSSTWKANVE